MVLYPRHRTLLYPKHMTNQKAWEHKASIPSLHAKPQTYCTRGPQDGSAILHEHYLCCYKKENMKAMACPPQWLLRLE